MEYHNFYLVIYLDIVDLKCAIFYIILNIDVSLKYFAALHKKEIKIEPFQTKHIQDLYIQELQILTSNVEINIYTMLKK